LSGRLRFKSFFVVVICFYFILENKHFKKYTHFTYLIKGTVIGRALSGANTFPTRKRLPDLDPVFAN